jgi:hypothetical protein
MHSLKDCPFLKKAKKLFREATEKKKGEYGFKEYET